MGSIRNVCSFVGYHVHTNSLTHEISFAIFLTLSIVFDTIDFLSAPYIYNINGNDTVGINMFLSNIIS